MKGPQGPGLPALAELEGGASLLLLLQARAASLSEAGIIVTDGEYTIRFDKDGFPEFRTKFETLLDKSHIGSGERLAHYKATNRKLHQAIKEDPELARALKLRPKDVEKLPDSKDPPNGYSWHHHQDVGRMQLVDAEEHQLSIPHMGGMAIWGGGRRP
jgi:hypothetical protein